MKKLLDLPFVSIVSGIIILGMLSFGISYSQAAEWNIYEGDSIQAVINNASDGDVIILHPGIYNENINLSGKAISLKSVDPNDTNIVLNTIIDGGQSGSVVTFDHGEKNYTKLDGIKLQNGLSNYGGGIGCFNQSSPYIINCIITNNLAFRGGGISCLDSSSPIITNCIVAWNTSSEEGGGIYCDESSPTISNCGIATNTVVNGKGGGISCYQSSPRIIDCTILENTSSGNGGGISYYQSSSEIINCLIESNSASDGGGGICCDHSSSPKIIDCSIIENNADYGGGVFCFDFSSAAINKCIIQENKCITIGGGINCMLSSPRITNCTIMKNTSSDGAGIGCYLSSSAFIDSCFILENTSSGYGGGIECQQSTPDITNCFIVGNSASKGGGIYCSDASQPNISQCNIAENISLVDGGGIYCYQSSPNITGCGIENNSASGSGGGICCETSSSPDIVDCQINNNQSLFGGGIFCFNLSSPNITNCIISGNSTSESGGGIYCFDSASPQISGCVISENSSSAEGGGIGCYQSFPIISNCIFFQNTASGNGGGISCTLSSPIITNCTFADNNSLQNGSSGIECFLSSSPYIVNSIFWNPGIEINYHSDSNPKLSYCNIQGGYPGLGNIDVNPMFADPEDNDYQLGNNSLCIDAGHPRKADTDGSRSDIGAYGGEGGWEEANPINITVAIDGSGDYTSIQDAIDYAVTGDTIIVCPGLYEENLVLAGKEVSIIRQNGIGSPVIDGFKSGSVIVFVNTGSNVNLKGFKIQKGSSSQGGGIACYFSSPIITNCTITNNKAFDYDGGGIFCYSSSPRIINCTISQNISHGEGSGVCCQGLSSPIMTNSILWGNTAKGGPSEIYLDSNSNIAVSYSNVQQSSDFYPGTGNINSDPLFVSDEQGNYFLTSNSPCIDRGTSTNAPMEDQEGIPRPQDLGIDMGAYEYVAHSSSSPRASFKVNQTTGIDSLSVDFDASGSGGSQDSEAGFKWDFGDGTSGTGQKVSHTYSGCNSYDVTLTIEIQGEIHYFTNHDLIKIRSSQITKEVGESFTYTSIQEAINDAVYGEIILVHDGTYFENIDFMGKAITVRSENGPNSTFIDGSNNGTVITFNNGEGEDSILKGFTIQNGSVHAGGGVFCCSSSPTVDNCIIVRNNAYSGGGIYNCCFASPTITKCDISENEAYNYGGGIRCVVSSSPYIINCVISGNAAFEGGGLSCNYSSPIITNCTFSKNETSCNGAGIHCLNSSWPAVINTILWGNMFDGSDDEIFLDHNSSITITYSDICLDNEVYGDPEDNNINADPLFSDPESGDFHLLSGSPCIDAGTSHNAPDMDKDGKSRPMKEGHDIGAYEFIVEPKPQPGTPEKEDGFIGDIFDQWNIYLNQFYYQFMNSQQVNTLMLPLRINPFNPWNLQRQSPYYPYQPFWQYQHQLQLPESILQPRSWFNHSYPYRNYYYNVFQNLQFGDLKIQFWNIEMQPGSILPVSYTSLLSGDF